MANDIFVGDKKTLYDKLALHSCNKVVGETACGQTGCHECAQDYSRPTVVQEELDAIKAYVTENNITPRIGSGCAFYVDEKCLIHDVRPFVCRAYQIFPWYSSSFLAQHVDPPTNCPKECTGREVFTMGEEQSAEILYRVVMNVGFPLTAENAQ